MKIKSPQRSGFAAKSFRRAPDHSGGSSKGISKWSLRTRVLRRVRDQEGGGPRDRNRDKRLTQTAVAYGDDSKRLAIAWRITNLVRLRLGRKANSLDRFGRKAIRYTELRADADQLGRMQCQLKWFVEPCLGSVATEADERRVEQGTNGS